MTWKDKENHELMLKEVLKCANGYLQEAFKMISQERFAGKVA
jgi:hypothetical protein